MLGDDSRLPFIYLASLRSHLLRQPLLTALTTLVIALSVALVIALGLSSRSVEQALTIFAEALRGRADLEITAGAVGMPERLLEEVSKLPSVAAAAPVISAIVRIVGGPGDGRPLRVLGVDLLADQSVRSYSMIQTDLRVIDPLRLVTASDSVIVSQILARELGLSDGATLTVRSSLGEHALIVRGVLSTGGMGDAYAGQLVVMDVYALQALLARQGSLDRIDLVLAPSTDVEEAKVHISARVEGVATVRLPVAASQFAGTALSTLAFIADVMALVGTLVAGFLCYAALATSVDRRTRLFALLRAAGMETKRIHRVVFVDSLAVAVAGVGIGIPLGLWLSRLFSGVFSETSSWLSGVKIEPVPLSWGVPVLGALVGVGVSLLGGAVAARRSTRLPPHEAIAGGRGLGPDLRRVSSLPALALRAVLLTAWIAASSVALPVPAVYRVATVFVLGMTVLWAGLGSLLGAFVGSIQVGFERLVPGIGRVAGGSLQMRLNQTRIAVAAIAALLASTSSLWIVTTSVFSTIDLAVSTKGGAVLSASDLTESAVADPLVNETVDKIEKSPGVTAMLRHFVTHILYRGENVRLSAITPGVWADRVGFDLIERTGDDAEVVLALQAGGVLVTDGFQRHFGTKIGEMLRLDTPEGPRSFPVVGIRRAYPLTSSVGAIQMDLSTFDRHWTRPGLSNLIVWTVGDERTVLSAVQRAAGARQPVFFRTSAEIDRSMRSDLDRYRVPILALLGFVMVLGGAAIVNLLVGSAQERSGDIALLRCVGASRRQLMGLVLLESLFVGAAGAIAGLGLGMACALPIRALVAERLGWVVSWHIQPTELLVLAIGTAGISALVGVVIGFNVRRWGSWNSLAPE